jgi:hypothetical protein
MIKSSSNQESTWLPLPRLIQASVGAGNATIASDIASWV